MFFRSSVFDTFFFVVDLTKVGVSSRRNARFYNWLLFFAVFESHLEQTLHHFWNPGVPQVRFRGPPGSVFAAICMVSETFFCYRAFRLDERPIQTKKVAKILQIAIEFQNRAFRLDEVAARGPLGGDGEHSDCYLHYFWNARFLAWNRGDVFFLNSSISPRRGARSEEQGGVSSVICMVFAIMCRSL